MAIINDVVYWVYWFDVVALGLISLATLRGRVGHQHEVIGALAAVLAGGVVVCTFGAWYTVGATALLLPLATVLTAVAAIFIARVSSRLLCGGWRRSGVALAAAWAALNLGSLTAFWVLVAPGLLACFLLPVWMLNVSRASQGPTTRPPAAVAE